MIPDGTPVTVTASGETGEVVGFVMRTHTTTGRRQYIVVVKHPDGGRRRYAPEQLTVHAPPATLDG